VRLKQRLATDPQIRPLLAQFVPVNLKVNGAEFQQLARAYPPKGKDIPMLYVIDSSGKEIYNASGAPSGEGLLIRMNQWIKATGGPRDLTKLDPAAVKAKNERLLAAARKADGLIGRDKIRDAVEILAPLAEDSDVVEGASVGGKQIAQLFEKLSDTAEAALDKARPHIASEDKGLYAGLILTKLRRQMGRLPAVDQAIQPLQDQLSQRSDGAALVAQAAAIDEGRAEEDAGDSRGAILAYKKVVEQFPGTLAAKLCETRIDQLSSRIGGSTTARPVAKPSGDSPAADERTSKKAASLLRLAKFYAGRRDYAKAREYAQRVLQLVSPETRAGAEAQRLLK